MSRRHNTCMSIHSQEENTVHHIKKSIRIIITIAIIILILVRLQWIRYRLQGSLVQLIFWPNGILRLDRHLIIAAVNNSKQDSKGKSMEHKHLSMFHQWAHYNSWWVHHHCIHKMLLITVIIWKHSLDISKGIKLLAITAE